MMASPAPSRSTVGKFRCLPGKEGSAALPVPETNLPVMPKLNALGSEGSSSQGLGAQVSVPNHHQGPLGLSLTVLTQRAHGRDFRVGSLWMLPPPP